MDIRMPELDGLEAARRDHLRPPARRVKVVILTTFDIDDYVYAALRAGATGFLLKDTEPEELIHAVRVVARGDALISPSSPAGSSPNSPAGPRRPNPAHGSGR